MKMFLDCIPCLVFQTLELLRCTTDDELVRERLLRETLRMLSASTSETSPPRMAQQIYRFIGEQTQVEDPFRRKKDRLNRMALDLYPGLKARVRDAVDPLETAVRLAIAGNTIDLGPNIHLTRSEVDQAVEDAMQLPLEGDLKVLCRAFKEARTIFYLADNAGEIVFDRLLIEQLPLEKVVLGVRGFPIINDATMRDAREAGLTELVEVIHNNSDAPGTILGDCSPAFRRTFEEADLVIAKGQGNYETLNNAEQEIFFLLRAKCSVIAWDLGCEIGSLVIRKHLGRY